MKKLLTLFLFIASSFPAFSQNAPDFTITTTDGVTRNLYAALNDGKTVVLDFFYPSCQSCYYYSPIIEQSYVNYGSGTGSIEYWGINGGFELVNDNEVDDYKLQYGITNPCASGLEGNGKYVDSLYHTAFGIIGYPTFAVICPDKTIYWDVNDPVPTVTGFDTYFASCAATAMAPLTDEIFSASIAPNPVLNGTINLSFDGIQPSAFYFHVFNLHGESIVSGSFNGVRQIALPSLSLPAGIYTVQIINEEGESVTLKMVIPE